MAESLLERILKAEICSYCFGEAEYIDSAEVYQKSFGMIYLCRACNSYVSVATLTNQPPGIEVSVELRRLRKHAHDVFDTIFQTGLINQLYPHYLPGVSDRQKAYLWLAHQMNKKEEDCHMALFNESECRRVIDICSKVLE